MEGDTRHHTKTQRAFCQKKKKKNPSELDITPRLDHVPGSTPKQKLGSNPASKVRIEYSDPIGYSPNPTGIRTLLHLLNYTRSTDIQESLNTDPIQIGSATCRIRIHPTHFPGLRLCAITLHVKSGRKAKFSAEISFPSFLLSYAAIPLGFHFLVFSSLDRELGAWRRERASEREGWRTRAR